MTGMQLQLFPDLPLPPRPKYFSDEVTGELIDSIIPKVASWLQDGRSSPISVSEIEEGKADLSVVIDYEDDAYKILRGLDDLGWSVDDELHDIMKEVSRFRYNIWKDHVHHWVLKNGITPRHNIGDVVQFNSEGKLKQGVIRKSYPRTAEYAIHLEEESSKKKGYVGSIVHFESLVKN